MAPPARVDELKKRYEENPRRFFAPLANEYRKAGDLEAAIDLCRMHLEEQPGHLSGHIVYGQALYESARAPEAKSIFEAALTLDPENLIALRHLGDIAKADGDATAAKHWYGRVLEADPRNDEVIALIDALGQAAPVVLAEQHEPPPTPNYAVESEAVPAVDPNAPTPAVSLAAVPPAAASAAPRLSIGLMDLDLNLADSTAPTVDLLGDVPAAPSAPAAFVEASVEPPAEAPVMAEAPPAVLEPAPAVDDTFALIDTSSSAPEIEGSGMPGVEDLSLGTTVPGEPPVEVLDTSFGAPPSEDESMFAAAPEAPEFGDSLDVTASVEFDAPPPRLSGPLGGLEVEDVSDTVPIGEPMTDPQPARAVPATPADFEALFGNASISAVNVGGDDTPTLAGDEGFQADSFVGREPTDEALSAAPEIATPPSPFVTETMAELYLQQGFRDEALNVYRQLLAQNPDDKGLAERVMHLEHGTRSSLAIDSVSEQIEAAAEAEEIRKSGSIAAVPAPPAAPALELAPEAPVSEAPVSEAPMPEAPMPEAVAPLADAVPAFLVEAPPAVAPTPVPVGPLARDVFARIASRRAVPGGGVAAPAAEPAAERTSSESSAPAVAAPAAAAAESADSAAAPPGEVTVAPGGAVDRVFGISGVAAVDEGAAIALATAFGATPAPTPIRGEPTRKGTDELSLDSVFGEEAAPRSSMVQRQSSTLRFDQFFSGAEGGASAPAVPPPGASPAAGDDIAQFSDWLKGLKGS